MLLGQHGRKNWHWRKIYSERADVLEDENKETKEARREQETFPRVCL